MSKVLQVVIYKSINDEEKLAAYAELAGPAMKAAGAKFLARGVPLAVKEEGQKTRTVVVEFPDYNTAIECYDSKEYQDAHEVLNGHVVRHHQIVEAS